VMVEIQGEATTEEQPTSGVQRQEGKGIKVLPKFCQKHMKTWVEMVKNGENQRKVQWDLSI